MAFYVGQKVEFVGPSLEGYGFGWEIMPKIGGVYTIREIVSSALGHQGFKLVEIVNRPAQYRQRHDECNFIATRFRPIVERKTDISIFTDMLNPSDERVQA